MKFTKYEKARVIGSRALQLAMGAPMLIKMAKDELIKLNFNPVRIAIMEYDQGILPITIKRPLP